MPTPACSVPDDHFKMPCVPGYPKLRAGTQLDALYERLSRKGRGFRRPGMPEGKPHVLVVFDPRCVWSHIFWQTSRILEKDVDFEWFPVCVTADLSTAQAAAILAADEPWELMREHQDAFEDEEFCGIRPEDYPVTQDERNVVWENARIFRKAGGTSVPLGIFRTSQGEFKPLFGDMSAEEIRAALGL